MDVDLHSRSDVVSCALLFIHFTAAGDSPGCEDKIVINTDVNTERVWDKEDHSR